MPIYEYHCKPCDKDFEELVLSKDETISCPECGGSEVSRLMSVCAHKTAGGEGGGDTFRSSAGAACSSCAAASCASCK